MQPIAVGQVGNAFGPAASEPWHCEQLFMNRRSPMAMACGLRATSSGFMAMNLAYSGFNSALPFSTSASYSPFCGPAQLAAITAPNQGTRSG